jgi:hypothetical protein
MINVDIKPRRWGIWTTTQLKAGASEGDGINPKLRAYIPINPSSHFSGGYSVLYGSAHNSQFEPDLGAGMMRVHYERKVGKIGLDSSAGWVATVDGTSGHVFVQGFSFEPGREYPDGSSVEYWTNGLGTINAWGKQTTMPSDVAGNPYLVESELIGPFANLQPGEQHTFDYEWRACRIGGDYAISACTPVACTAEEFRIERRKDSVYEFFGRFGVFHLGEVRVTFWDSEGKQIESADSPATAVTPTEPLVLDDIFRAVRVPDRAADIVLSIHDRAGAQLGELGRASVGK